MKLACSQVLLDVTDLGRAREFYVTKLELPVVEDHPRMFAFRAGDVRFSVFGGAHAQDREEASAARMKIMFRCDDIEAAVQRLRERGVEPAGPIEEAPGFMRHVELRDPDNNLIYLAQYLRDPLKRV